MARRKGKRRKRNGDTQMKGDGERDQRGRGRCTWKKEKPVEGLNEGITMPLLKW